MTCIPARIPGSRLVSPDRLLTSGFGAPGRTRTCNLRIRRPLHYPLCYGGYWARCDLPGQSVCRSARHATRQRTALRHCIEWSVDAVMGPHNSIYGPFGRWAGSRAFGGRGRVPGRSRHGRADEASAVRGDRAEQRQLALAGLRLG